EHARALLGPDRLQPEGVDDTDRLVAELGGQRAAERGPLHLARQPLLVRARMRPEDRPAAPVVGRGTRALAGAARALLAVRLLAAAANLAAGTGGVGAHPADGQLARHRL